MTDRPKSVVALAGGVGGARLADGLAQALPIGSLTIVVNVGDDFNHLGLRICPDLDTVCYTLAGKSSPDTGWGLLGDTKRTLEAVQALGGPGWFGIGDLDLATHLERTRRLALGEPLSRVTAAFCATWGVAVQILPVTDDAVPTVVESDEGDLAFQEYFVHRGCRPKVSGFRFEGVDDAHPAPGVLEAIASAEAIVFCPSNPWVSLDPILAVPGLRTALLKRRAAGAALVGVSPIIGGQTVKGPAAKMYAELGVDPSALAVARHYAGLLNGFVYDRVDAAFDPEITALGFRAIATDTLMRDRSGRRRLAQEVLDFIQRLMQV